MHLSFTTKQHVLRGPQRNGMRSDEQRKNTPWKKKKTIRAATICRLKDTEERVVETAAQQPCGTISQRLCLACCCRHVNGKKRLYVSSPLRPRRTWLSGAQEATL